MTTQGIKMMNYRVVAEIMLLYGLDAEAMRTMVSLVLQLPARGRTPKPRLHQSNQYL